LKPVSFYGILTPMILKKRLEKSHEKITGFIGGITVFMAVQ
jgi:hypothetical protein